MRSPDENRRLRFEFVGWVEGTKPNSTIDLLRDEQANEQIFIALDGQSHSKCLSGRSVARVVDN